MTDLRWVEDRSIVVASDSGAVGLWELDENETLVVSKACKYEHGDSATVGVLSSGILAAKVRDLGQQMELSSYQAPSRHVTCIAASLRGFCFFPAVRTRECYCVMPEPKPASLRGCSAPVAFLSLARHPEQSEVFVFGDESGAVPCGPRVRAGLLSS